MKVYGCVSKAINIYRQGGKVYYNLETDSKEQKSQSLKAVSTSMNVASRMKRKCSAQEN